MSNQFKFLKINNNISTNLFAIYLYVTSLQKKTLSLCFNNRWDLILFLIQ